MSSPPSPPPPETLLDPEAGTLSSLELLIMLIAAGVAFLAGVVIVNARIAERLVKMKAIPRAVMPVLRPGDTGRGKTNPMRVAILEQLVRARNARRQMLETLLASRFPPQLNNQAVQREDTSDQVLALSLEEPFTANERLMLRIKTVDISNSGNGGNSGVGGAGRAASGASAVASASKAGPDYASDNSVSSAAGNNANDTSASEGGSSSRRRKKSTNGPSDSASVANSGVARSGGGTTATSPKGASTDKSLSKKIRAYEAATEAYVREVEELLEYGDELHGFGVLPNPQELALVARRYREAQRAYIEATRSSSLQRKSSSNTVETTRGETASDSSAPILPLNQNLSWYDYNRSAQLKAADRARRAARDRQREGQQQGRNDQRAVGNQSMGGLDKSNKTFKIVSSGSESRDPLDRSPSPASSGEFETPMRSASLTAPLGALRGGDWAGAVSSRRDNAVVVTGPVRAHFRSTITSTFPLLERVVSSCQPGLARDPALHPSVRDYCMALADILVDTAKRGWRHGAADGKTASEFSVETETCRRQRMTEYIRWYERARFGKGELNLADYITFDRVFRLLLDDLDEVLGWKEVQDEHERQSKRARPVGTLYI